MTDRNKQNIVGCVKKTGVYLTHESSRDQYEFYRVLGIMELSHTEGIEIRDQKKTNKYFTLIVFQFSE